MDERDSMEELVHDLWKGLRECSPLPDDVLLRNIRAFVGSAAGRQMSKTIKFAVDIKESPGGPEKWVGKMVKKQFPHVGNRVSAECMWLKVTGFEGGRLVGVLRNEPLYATYMHFGDTVTLDETEIMAADDEKV